MSSDPRAKPSNEGRHILPKAYTEEQLSYLRSHLTEFERRTNGSVRGEAKKFALERATSFIVRFGLPEDFRGVEESDARFREQIYNWFKNSIGRNRRKSEGRPRNGRKPTSDKVSHSPSEIRWNTELASPTIIPYTHAESSNPPSNAPSIPPATTRPPAVPVPYGGAQPSAPVVPPAPIALQIPAAAAAVPIPAPAPMPVPTHISIPAPVPAPVRPSPSLNPQITTATLRDAFRTPTITASALSAMIQTFVLANPSPTPLTPVIYALFDAVTAADAPPQSPARPGPGPAPPPSRDPFPFLRRFLDAATYFPPALAHAGVTGPLAAARALQMQIRRNSTWLSGSALQHARTGSPGAAPSMGAEMQRIAADRQRRRDYIQWARIHAAALELGVLAMGYGSEADAGRDACAPGRSLSEMVARDSVWEQDEVEWVAGVYVLRSVIRTAVRGDARRREEYAELLATYEKRWKEIKDEARQSLVTEVLLGAKEDLARLDDSH